MIYIFPSVLLFILGTLVGSFLNVVGMRFNAGMSLRGRSFCFSCRRTLRWYELIPIVSFLWQKARCSVCKSRISWKYPLVEVWSGLIFATVYRFQFSIWQNLIILAAFSIFIVITIYDIRHKIIPNKLVYPAIALSFIYALFFTPNYLSSIISGLILFSFFVLIWAATRGRAMGFGDAKLGLAIGLLLGLKGGLSALGLSFWIGMIATLGYMAILKSYPLFGLYKRLTMKSEIPFAPYFVLGAWISFIFQFDLFHVAYLLQ